MYKRYDGDIIMQKSVDVPVKKNWKMVIIPILATLGVLLSLNVWTYTPVGEKKVEVCMGEVTGTVLDNGLHAAKPWCSYDLMTIQNQLKTFNNTLLPTQDRMNSFGIVNLKFRLKDGAAVDVRKDFGNEERFFEKTLYADLPNILKSESRKLKDSANLADDAYVSKLVSNTRDRLNENLGDKIDIQEVQLLDIQFDPLI
ncbi:SPFH domain-containing protein, partial [Salmonella enterica subsp. enterica serovar Kentucky]|uniref:SPFH domain-containing protein n=1 Tax=Salmonella enterica TaxID=28901 RepID=UPI003F4C792A